MIITPAIAYHRIYKSKAIQYAPQIEQQNQVIQELCDSAKKLMV
jgi:hypothetical protein